MDFGIEWEESIIVSLYKGVEGVTLKQGNYRGLELLRVVMNFLERVAENVPWQQVLVDDMQSGFGPGWNTTDAIFIIRWLQEIFHAINKTLYMAFVDLEKKTFHHVPRRVIW